MKYETIKGSEKDFEGAPEWATKLLGETCVSKKAFAGDLGGVAVGAYKENPRYWWKLNERNMATIIAERRPITEPVWDGEGIPPVGVECEILWNDDWVKCVVKAYGEEQIIFKAEGSREWAGHINNYHFRPIRSPEDAARDEAIEAMRDVGYTLPAAIRFTKEEMAALYDAGYRKIDSSSADLKINITTDEMWREFEKKSDMEDVYKLITKRMGKKLCGF